MGGLTLELGCIFLVLLLQGLFLSLKGAAWHTAYESSGLPSTFFRSLKIFCSATLCEALTLLPFIGADAYRAWFYREHKGRTVVMALMLARVPSMLWLVICVSIALWQNELFLYLSVFALILGVLLAIIRRPSRAITEDVQSVSLVQLRALMTLAFVKIFLFQVTAFFADYLRFLCIAVLLGLDHTISFIQYCACIFLGVVSIVPFGIGLRDVSLATQFPPGTEVKDVVFLMMLLRFFGEGATAVIGALFIWRDRSKPARR